MSLSRRASPIRVSRLRHLSMQLVQPVAAAEFLLRRRPYLWIRQHVEMLLEHSSRLRPFREKVTAGAFASHRD